MRFKTDTISKTDLLNTSKMMINQESLGTLNLGGFPMHPAGNAEYLSRSVKQSIAGGVSANRGY